MSELRKVTESDYLLGVQEAAQRFFPAYTVNNLQLIYFNEDDHAELDPSQQMHTRNTYSGSYIDENGKIQKFFIKQNALIFQPDNDVSNIPIEKLSEYCVHDEEQWPSSSQLYIEAVNYDIFKACGLQVPSDVRVETEQLANGLNAQFLVTSPVEGKQIKEISHDFIPTGNMKRVIKNIAETIPLSILCKIGDTHTENFFVDLDTSTVTRIDLASTGYATFDYQLSELSYIAAYIIAHNTGKDYLTAQEKEIGITAIKEGVYSGIERITQHHSQILEVLNQWTNSDLSVRKHIESIKETIRDFKDNFSSYEAIIDSIVRELNFD